MDDIEFEPLASAIDYAQLLAELPLPDGLLIEQELSETGVLRVPFGLSVELQAFSTQFGTLNATLRPVGVLSAVNGALLLAELPAPAFGAASGLPTPSVSLLLAALPVPALQASTYTVTFGEIDAAMDPPSGILIGPEGGALLAELPAPAFGASSGPPGAINDYALISQSPGFIWAYGAWEYELLSDALRFSGTAADRLGVILADQLLLGQSLAVQGTYTGRSADRLQLAAQISAGFRMLLGDALSFTDSASITGQALAEVIDFLLLSETVHARRDAIAIVVSGLALADLSAAADAVLLDDALEFSEALDVRLQAAVVLVDSLLLDDGAQGTGGFSAIVADSLDLGDSIAVAAALIAIVQDGFRIVGRLRLGEEEFIGYVCNAANRAFTTYTGFNFNSMAGIGGRYFAAGDDGLYLLDGDDDDGEPIRARARMALTNLGTGKQKRMPSAYIGYSGGRLILKTITTSAEGLKQEHWYRVEARPAEATRESRIPIGRGLKSVYWAFELVNDGGDAFELDTLQLFPMILERRL